MSAPLVSVVVRSMGRPELELALQSLARQDHPHLEVIVVDATGGRHPALPPIAWREGHSVRMVGGHERLPRPDAANVGLDAVRGEWFGFLDDDDTCEPTHLTSLLAASVEHPDALLVYGQGRLLDAGGRVQDLFGFPFNRALMHYGPLFYWQAALIRTRIRDLGCRFDPAFDVCEDRDLLAQIAQHGDFAFAPRAAAFNFRPDLGTSGTGRGANRNDARCALYNTKLAAKWSGPAAYHWARVAGRCRRSMRALAAGDFEAAQRGLELVLRDYPSDPHAIHGLARVALARGDAQAALALARDAVRIDPTVLEHCETLILAQRTVSGPIPRNAPCPCASGRSYKKCCGRIPGDSAGPPQTARAREACAAASAALEENDAERAYRVLAEAQPQAPDARFLMLLESTCERLHARERDESLWRTARALFQRLRARVPAAGAGSTLETPDERFELAAAFDKWPPARIVIRLEPGDPRALIERLVEVEESGAAIRVDVAARDDEMLKRLGVYERVSV